MDWEQQHDRSQDYDVSAAQLTDPVEQVSYGREEHSDREREPEERRFVVEQIYQERQYQARIKHLVRYVLLVEDIEVCSDYDDEKCQENTDGLSWHRELPEKNVLQHTDTSMKRGCLQLFIRTMRGDWRPRTKRFWLQARSMAAG